jgi:hypothetical protein
MEPIGYSTDEPVRVVEYLLGLSGLCLRAAKKDGTYGGYRTRTRRRYTPTILDFRKQHSVDALYRSLGAGTETMLQQKPKHSRVAPVSRSR